MRTGEADIGQGESRRAGPERTVGLREAVPRIGILSNLRAGRNAVRASQMVSLLTGHPNVVHVETEAVESVPRILSHFANQDIDLLVINGGDGTLQQALTTRLTTNKGDNPLYKNVGYDRVVGLNLETVDIETARFRILAAVTADPRIGAVRRLLFEDDETSPDALIIDADVEVRGLSQGAKIQAIGV